MNTFQKYNLAVFMIFLYLLNSGSEHNYVQVSVISDETNEAVASPEVRTPDVGSQGSVLHFFLFKIVLVFYFIFMGQWIHFKNII